MRRAVRAIIIRDGVRGRELLVMHRSKEGRQYYTLIGGDIDAGETQETALYREIAEETGVEVTNPRLVFVEVPANQDYPQYIYLCDYISGEPALAPDSVEAELMKLGKNLHTPMWLPLDELMGVSFLSPVLQQRLHRSAREGWPDEPERIEHHQV